MLAELTAAASGNAELSLIVGFLAGYLVILVTPGPNMLAVAGIASLQGVRGAAPFCAGIALGAGALGAALLLAIGAAADAVRTWEVAARMVGALLLLCVAVTVGPGTVWVVVGPVTVCVTVTVGVPVATGVTVICSAMPIGMYGVVA